MRHFLFFFCLFPLFSQAQSLYFPPNTGNSWDTLSPASQGYCPDRIDSLYTYLESADSKAFILLKDGKIVLEKYFGTFTQDSVWYWASAAKGVKALAFGIAQQESHLSISDTTSHYLGTGWTDLTPSQEEKITIWHQLTMTSGLDDGVPDNYCTLDSCLQYLADPGTRWAYHNAPYTLLNPVLEQATGQTYQQYINQKIFLPTGMLGLFINSGYNSLLISKPRSMARFGLLMLNRGVWNGNPILTDTAYFNQMVTPSQTLNNAYGLLWWLNGQSSYMLPQTQFIFPGKIAPNAPDDMYAALGKNGQVINIVPSENLVWIRMGNATTGEIPGTLNDSIWRRINELVCQPLSTQESSFFGEDIVVYPNPATEKLMIRCSVEPVRYSVIDLAGKQRFASSNPGSRSEIDTNLLPAGIYFLRVEFEGQTPIIKKFVKQ